MTSQAGYIYEQHYVNVRCKAVVKLLLRSKRDEKYVCQCDLTFILSVIEIQYHDDVISNYQSRLNKMRMQY